MSDFMKAVATALKRNENYDYVQEYENLYIFSIKDAPESFGGFDASLLINKADGSITSYLELADNGNGDWLNNLISEGNLFERIDRERNVSSTHQPRYMFEHRLIPDLLYKEGLGFMASIVSEGNVLNKIFLEMLEKHEIENPYGEEAIKVEPFRIKDIIVARIIFPEPEEEPLCYESYAFFDTVNERAGYYCLEKGGTIDDEPFLCGWSEDGVHLNYNNCSFDRDELIANMLRLFLGIENENTPELTVAYRPNRETEE